MKYSAEQVAIAERAFRRDENVNAAILAIASLMYDPPKTTSRAGRKLVVVNDDKLVQQFFKATMDAMESYVAETYPELVPQPQVVLEK